MACLKGGVVANVVVPTPDYVRLATHYGFRLDFCEAADPESVGIVEHLVGYAKGDLLVPQRRSPSLTAANDAAQTWCVAVNTQTYSEIAAERELLGPLPSLRLRIGHGHQPQGRPAVVRAVRLGPLLGTHPPDRAHRPAAQQRRPAAGGGDTHRRDRRRPSAGGARRDLGRRCALRRCATGATAGGATQNTSGEGVLRARPDRRGVHHRRRRGWAHPAGARTEQLAALEAAHGREVLLAALERAVTFGRWRAADVRSILDAGAGTPPSPPGRGRPGARAAHGAGQVAGRLRHRPIRGRCTVTAPTPTLAPDLHAGLRRLKLAAMPPSPPSCS
jgi:hypothetical protein